MPGNDAGASCPYAVVVSDDDEQETEDVMQLARKSCPAFKESGSCPFKDAKTGDDVKHTLLQVPPSHLESSGHFQKALKHLHHVNQNLDNEEQYRLYHLPGGCPMQTYYPSGQQEGNKGVPFVTAMEEWSLAAIMARMASDLDHEEHDDDSSDDDDEQPETSTTPASPSTKQTEPVPVESSTTTAPSSSSTVTPDSPSGSSLAEALKTGTAASHQAAEDVHFVRNFIRGKIDRDLYGELVLSLYHVYDALEEELDRYAPQYFPKCHFPKELARKETLEEDVDFWHGDIVKNKMSDATRDYVERIYHIAETDPLLLLSHAYTRYLGDLSGGKILARVARKALNLDRDGEGLRFYEFDGIKSAKKFKDQYRQALDQLNLSTEEISRLVGEANVAFLLNMRIFEELDVMAAIPGSSVRNLEDALTFAKAENNTTAASECPFATVNAKGETVYGDPASTQKGGRCPWPFVFMHDPKTGMQDWQTWLVLGFVFCWVWSHVQSAVV